MTRLLTDYEVQQIHDDALYSILGRGQVEALTSYVRHLKRVVTAMNNVTSHQTNRIPVKDVQGEPINQKWTVHPLTCGNDSNHTPLFPFFNWKENRMELHCRDCDYTQDNGAIYDIV